MIKDEYVQLLNENGYRSALEAGVILVQYTDENPFDAVKTLLRQEGFNGSFGVMKVKNMKNEQNTQVIESEEI